MRAVVFEAKRKSPCEQIRDEAHYAQHSGEYSISITKASGRKKYITVSEASTLSELCLGVYDYVCQSKAILRSEMWSVHLALKTNIFGLCLTFILSSAYWR